jgi:hypothetical protein
MQRALKVKDELTALRDAHEAGTYEEGPEALNATLTRILSNAQLTEMRSVQVDRIGVHPDNREKAKLIAYDVQGLIYQTFYINGFNPDKWECCALTILPEVYDFYMSENKKVVSESAGLLPPIYDMELATGRGSHGVSALRCLKYPTRSAHPEIANSNGEISMSKVLEKQPSLKEPLEKGVMVRVLYGEVERLVPRIFSMFSRLGNVTNSHFRLQTCLQSCKRIHAIAVPMMDEGEGINWDKVGRLAAIGMNPAEVDNISKLCAFVQRWSGGKDAKILDDLESYEKTLLFRRNILAADLQILAECEIDEYDRIIPVP